jgi:hypothetical protein
MLITPPVGVVTATCVGCDAVVPLPVSVVSLPPLATVPASPRMSTTVKAFPAEPAAIRAFPGAATAKLPLGPLVD